MKLATYNITRFESIVLLAGANVFVERSADGAWGSVELLDHTLDLLTETCLVEVETEDILAAVEGLQTAPVLIGLADL